MLRRIRVGQRLLGGFALLILVILAVAGVGLWKMSVMKTRGDYVAANSLPSVVVLDDLNTALSDYRVAQIERFTTGDRARSAAADAAMARAADAADAALKTYAGLLSNADDRALLDRATGDWGALRGVTERARNLPPASAATLAAAEGATVFARLRATQVDWVRLNTGLASDMVSGTASAFSAAKLLMAVFVLAAVLIAAGVAFLITRSLVGPLTQLGERLVLVGDGDLTVRLDVHGRDELADVGNTFNAFAGRIQEVMRRVTEACRSQLQVAEDMARGAEQAGLAVGQIATTVDEVARGSQEQAESTARVSETMHEMSQGVQRVSGAGESAAGLAEEADRAADEGARTVEEATAAMASIERRVGDAAAIVVSLGERGSEVGLIVDTISDIAEQTNLLALNAAIEAARAGEMGRGFAVVADEVRKLAESTQEQVGSISSIVAEIQRHTTRAVEAMEAGREDVTTGVRRVGAAGEAFTAIRRRVAELSEEVMSVAAAAEQLEAGASEVRESLSSVAAVSEENAASVEEVSASTEETSATAEETAASAQQVAASARDLAELVSGFRT